MSRTYKKWITPILCLLLLGCKGSDESPRVSDTSYFPLQGGRYWIYDVTETDILQTSCGDGGQTNLVYQIKAQVTDSLLNSEGIYAYTIHRYTRADSTQPWLSHDTWTSRVSNTQAINNESNVSFIKLLFPFSGGLMWNGNEYNDQALENYTLSNIGKSYSLPSGMKFDKTVTVIQSDNDDVIVYQDKRSEVYAQHVGLVYKSTTQLHYFTDQTCLGQQKVQTGLIYEQSLKTYGRE